AEAPGQALSDFNIFKLVAHYWGYTRMFREWTSPEAVFQLLKRLSANRPCDFTGIINYQHLDECGGIQWPWSETMVEFKIPDGQITPATERGLFEDGCFFTGDGKARFIFEKPRTLPE